MKQWGSLIVLLALRGVTPSPLKADNITLPNVVFNLDLTEDALENLAAANVTMKIGANAAVGGAAAVNADKIHFTFPFAIALDDRFTGAGMGISITLQNFLDNVLSTAPGSPNQGKLDGGDPISYAANGGTPIGAFHSLPGDDSEAETGATKEKDSWVVTLQRQIGQNSILFQSFQVNYSIDSPAEGKAIPEVPEPASWVMAAGGLLAAWVTKGWRARCRPSAPSLSRPG